MNAPGQPPLPALWPSVWKLLRLRWIIMVNNFRRSKLRAKISTVFLGLVILGFLAFMFFIVWRMLALLREPELAQITGQIHLALQRLPGLVFTGTFLGVFITSFGVLLQAMYLAGDMDFLLSTPVPIRAVFVAKLLQAVLPNFGLVCLFALPVLFGLGVSSGYSWVYYPAVAVTISALALTAAGLSALGVMSVVRFFPARRVAEVLGFLGAVLSFLCSQSGQLAGRTGMDGGDAEQALALLERAEFNWSPLTWAAHGVIALGERRWLAGAGWTLLSLAVAAGLFAISLVIAEKLYYSGWAGLQGAALKRRPVKNAAPAGANRRNDRARGALLTRLRAALGLRPSPLIGILTKDWLTLRRDLRNLSQLITPLILGVVYAVMVLDGGVPGADSDMPPIMAELMANIATYTSIALSLFVGWMLLGRLAGMGFGQEGRSYWMLKAAPVSAGQLILAKFIVAVLPTLAISGLYLLALAVLQRVTLPTLLYMLAVMALCVAGNAGVNLAFGIAGANLNWEDPRQMQRASMGCLGALASMIYLPISLAAFFGPAVLLPVFGAPDWIGQAMGLLLGGGLCMACAIFPPFAVRGKVMRLGEA